MSFAATGTLIITPQIGAVTLGASVAQTSPGATTAQAWYLRLNVVFRVIAAGAASTAIGTGFFTTAGDASLDSTICIPFGGTSATVDITANTNITVRKTLSVAGSMTTQYAYIYSLN